MSCPKCKKKRCNCPEPVQGPIGLTGPQGIPGPMGPMPAHEWDGCSIRFQNPDGSWGPWKNLEGPQGQTGVGVQGSTGVQGVPGTQGIQGIQGEKGATGPQGADGISVSRAQIDENGDLIMYYSDGTQENAGSVQLKASSTELGPNEKAYLFRARNTTEQRHTGGLVPGTILAFPDDKSNGYYDYGGSWSGNDFLIETSDPPTLRFHIDQLSIRNDGLAPEDVTVDIQWIPGATGVPQSIGSRLINIQPGTSSKFSFQTSDNLFNDGDRMRVVVLSQASDLVIESYGELWNVEI